MIFTIFYRWSANLLSFQRQNNNRNDDSRVRMEIAFRARTAKLGIAGDDWFIGKMPQQADSRHSLEKKVHYTITMVMFHYRWEMSDMRVMRARGKFKPLDSWRSSLMMHCEQSRLSSRSDIQSSRIFPTHLKTIPNTQLWRVGASKVCSNYCAERRIQLSRLNLGFFKKIERNPVLYTEKNKLPKS